MVPPWALALLPPLQLDAGMPTADTAYRMRRSTAAAAAISRGNRVIHFLFRLWQQATNGTEVLGGAGWKLAVLALGDDESENLCRLEAGSSLGSWVDPASNGSWL